MVGTAVGGGTVGEDDSDGLAVGLNVVGDVVGVQIGRKVCGDKLGDTVGRRDVVGSAEGNGAPGEEVKLGFKEKAGDRNILPKNAPHVPTRVTLPDVGMVNCTVMLL